MLDKAYNNFMRRYSKNKTGYVFHGRVEEIAKDIQHALIKFQTSKAKNKRHKDVIFALDTTGNMIRVPIFVDISTRKGGDPHPYNDKMDAEFAPIGTWSSAENDFVGGIWIKAEVAKQLEIDYEVLSFLPPQNASHIRNILNHEIGHASREAELVKKTYEPKYKHKPTRKYRSTPEYILEHPIEFDAFMNELIFYYRDSSPSDIRFETYNDLFNEIIPRHVSKKAAKELQKPPWRQKIIKRLLREGIVLQR